MSSHQSNVCWFFFWNFACKLWNQFGCLWQTQKMAFGTVLPDLWCMLCLLFIHMYCLYLCALFVCPYPCSPLDSSRSESSKDSSKGGEDTNSNSGPWVQFWNELFVIVMCSGTHLDKISCIVVTWLLLILLWHIKFNLYTIWCIVSGYVIFCMQL
jgi:hypothetical protein